MAVGLQACGTGSEDPQETAAAPQAEAVEGRPEATSLLGEPLYPPQLDPETRTQREEALMRAAAEYRQDHLDEENIIWFGRRLAYLGRYGEANAVYSDGLALHPTSHKLLRHRGHRYISIRQLDASIADLERATELIEGVPDEVEPDGLPNARNIPTSTSHTNIHYHLGLARYLEGDFDEALGAYRLCLRFSTNDDMRCATSYWLYLTLRRLGRDREAAAVLEPVTAEMDIIENFAYHKLLLLYKGELAPEAVLGTTSLEGESIEDATVGYGVGAWYLLNGEPDRAAEIFRRIVSGPAWPAFGHIAAEAELARRRHEGTKARRHEGADS